MSVGTMPEKKRKASTLQDENAIPQAICNDDDVVIAKASPSPVLIQSEESSQQQHFHWNDSSSTDEEATVQQVEINDNNRVSFHNKVNLRYFNRVGLMQRHRVWYTRTDYVEFREREGKRRRDSVLESYGLLPTTTTTNNNLLHHNRRQEAAIINGDRSIRILERNIKVHKSNRSRYETQIQLLQQKAADESTAISKNCSNLVDSQASLQVSIQTFKLSSPITMIQQKDAGEDTDTLSKTCIEKTNSIPAPTCNVEKLQTPESSPHCMQISGLEEERIGEVAPPCSLLFRDEEEKLARIVALEAELALVRAYDL